MSSSSNPYTNGNPYINLNASPHPRSHNPVDLIAKIEKRQLADWVDRLRGCADEAQDERLRSLESDLLDLRTEINEYV